MSFEAWTTVVMVVVWLILCGYLLAGLRAEEGLPKRAVRPRRSEKLLTTLGVIMTVLDDALARFTAFVKDVAAQLTGAKEANDAQTAKLAELQAQLEAALADDAADSAAIAELQGQVTSLQDEVAAKINAALDAVANAPVEVPVEEPVTEEPVVEASAEEPVVADGNGPGEPVVQAAPVE